MRARIISTGDGGVGEIVVMAPHSDSTADSWSHQVADSDYALVSPPGGSVPFVPATGGVVAQVRGDLVAAAGAAGGVGVSTLVALLSPRPVMDLAVTRDWAGYRARWGTVPLVLVTRGTAAGLRAAVDRVGAAVEAGVAVAALVVVADGPWPVPRAVRGRIRLLADYVDAVVRVPYVTAWGSVRTTV